MFSLISKINKIPINLSKCSTLNIKFIVIQCKYSTEVLDKLRGLHNCSVVWELSCRSQHQEDTLQAETACKVLSLNRDSNKIYSGLVGKFSSLPEQLLSKGIKPECDALVINMGPSVETSTQTDRQKTPLDLRYSHSEDTLDCASLLKIIQFDNLKRILKLYGGVLRSKSIATAIMETRYLMQDISTVEDLWVLLHQTHRLDPFWQDKDEEDIHENIDKVFSALQIFVNDDLNELEFAVKMAEFVLSPEGLMVISARSEVERNFIKKLVFRKPGTITSQDEEKDVGVDRMWMSEGEKGGTELIYRKCVDSRNELRC